MGYGAQMPVLSAKVHVPSPRRQLVARPRLVDQLRAAPGTTPRLVLIAAPAGFGKTTVMTQWLAAQPVAAEHAPVVAWLASDDAADVTGQVFVVFGGRIHLMSGWEMVGEIEQGEQWSVAAIEARADELFGERPRGAPTMGFGR